MSRAKKTKGARKAPAKTLHGATPLQVLKASWVGPASLCTCGHSGDTKIDDATGSQHLGLQGHGACTKCPCSKFSWSGWTEAFEAACRRIPK